MFTRFHSIIRDKALQMKSQAASNRFEMYFRNFYENKQIWLGSAGKFLQKSSKTQGAEIVRESALNRWENKILACLVWICAGEENGWIFW